MKRWDTARDGKVYNEIQSLKGDVLSLYALESYAIIVDNTIQNELLRKLLLSHSDIARQLEETNQRLKESEKLLTEAQHIARIGRWDIDYVNGTRKWSDSYFELLQLSLSEKPSRELFMSLILPEDIELAQQGYHQLLSQREPWDGQIRLRLRNGEIIWVHIRLQTEFDEAGRPIRSLGTMQDITQIKRAEEKLERYSKHLEEMVADKVKEISESQMATIFALVKLAESRDDETGAHIERTASFCRLLAEKARQHSPYQAMIDDEYIATIYRASPLHDIGKVGISDLILLKPGKLTPEEFAIMKTHVEIGYQTLMNIDKRFQNNAFVQMGLDITRYHHEKWDGSGYLFELKGEQIPLSARMMALADVYDALRSKRVYKAAFPHNYALEIIEEGRGKHFDPTLVDLFLKSNQEFAELFDRLN
ncbi:MAG: HD domain-containing protein [Eubacteriales bacterium]|nr:HD domain-containing protein [Eubacteriales bacterium]